MTTMLDGKSLALKLRGNIKEEVEAIKAIGNRVPHLAAILVGEDGASKTYVNSKERDCEYVGFESSVHRLSADTSEESLLNLIEAINKDENIDGLIVQLPVPKHINATKVTEAIDPEIDVDGFHTISVGKLTKNEDTFISATPFGVIMMLEEYGIETRGKHCVIIGRSNIVGRPMSILMSQGGRDATVTVCHRYTENVGNFTRTADIVIVAVGIPDFLKVEMVKPGAVIVDVGITRVDSDNAKRYVLKGDVDFEKVKEKCSAITPVPGGVGPMTRYGLLFNTLKSYKKKQGL
ncbi:bifunctional 5,10-methylenetetrahydrofolate dehydrogenase/5,10-methenyltetrahydrofolate cyclohydrolase [Bacteroidia bacterium]|nr:bifunctional 5,10-methylenetetrahydrofolate dehydrogenase/5,10-methenyltetrahydrofolate cyclohydrolase [Bacteroidia bacterium]MDB4107344.1 bifunctional 5,10-methylenetetrahydrofolate dehydrogenase/5,10-methenyltetrahydrofolate cyclohydrolase [Bacteroidia bacterium]MDB9883110.1 bifunctional 5,10-methylenetetrahydrofolate dehydrogenase/5,10-methenyltetrahydrofolate cyclohydrolase [Bacteroidia bacterium]